MIAASAAIVEEQQNGGPMFSNVIRIADTCAMDLFGGSRTQKLLKTFAIRSAIFNIRCQRNMQRKHSDCCGNRRGLSNTKESPAGIANTVPAGDFLLIKEGP